jgi:hypothetical protein
MASTIEGVTVGVTAALDVTFPAMQQRSALVRFFAIAWAVFQVASPAVGAIADGRLAAANAFGPATHVEATTSSSCPQVHSPDCAICRYLSGPASPLPPAAIGFAIRKDPRSTRAESMFAHAGAIAFPPGRAPPGLNV